MYNEYSGAQDAWENQAFLKPFARLELEVIITNENLQFGNFLGVGKLFLVPIRLESRTLNYCRGENRLRGINECFNFYILCVCICAGILR